MSGRFVVRPQARRDAWQIANCIATDNLEVSDRFIHEVYAALQLLARSPQLGSARRFRREKLEGLRLWRAPTNSRNTSSCTGRPDGIEVIRVLHGARQIECLIGS